jgi:hypothetical protein
MPDLSDLVTGDADDLEPMAYRGRVTKVGATVNDPIEVVLVHWSATHPFEVPAEQWVGTVVPTVGKKCLVILDDEGDAWVPVV